MGFSLPLRRFFPLSSFGGVQKNANKSYKVNI